MIACLPLLGVLLSPPVLPASMPPEAAACLAELVAPAPSGTADRPLPGPCERTGHAPMRFTYAVGDTPQGGLPGADTTDVILDAGGHAIREITHRAGVAHTVTTRSWSGDFLKTEEQRPAPGAPCSPTVRTDYAMDDFGRPAGHTTTTVACDGTQARTQVTLAWQADGSARITDAQGVAQQAKGLDGGDWYTVTCRGAACACERRTYDSQQNLLRTRTRTATGEVQTATHDYGCWPPASPVTPPTPGLALRGKALYGQYCKTCHGETGVGDGPGGAGLPVRNLVAMGTAMCGQDNAILDTIRRGVGKMPGFPQLDAQQRRDILAYVRLLQNAGR